jgi:hypothetical protein
MGESAHLSNWMSFLNKTLVRLKDENLLKIPLWHDGISQKKIQKKNWTDFVVNSSESEIMKVMELEMSPHQFETIPHNSVEPSVFPSMALEPSTFSSAWSNLIANAESLEQSNNETALSEQLVGILQHHYPSADYDVIKNVVHMVRERSKNSPKVSSPTLSTSTIPESGSPSRHNNDLWKCGGKSTTVTKDCYPDVMESFEQSLFSHSNLNYNASQV